MPITTTDNEPDLFDLAARVAGCDPVDLLKVRRDPAGLVVILATGQKFIFDAGAISDQLDTAIRAQLTAVLGIELPPAPAADPGPIGGDSEKPAKSRRAR